MKLDLQKFFMSQINTQLAISHFDVCSVFASPKSKDLPSNIKTKIVDKYGDGYLDDADLLIFFKSNDKSKITDDQKDKIYGIIDRSLNKNANTLTKSDIVQLSVDCVFVKVNFI